MRLLSALYDVTSRFGKILTRRAWPLHCDEDVAPFFIVGAGRSGTTLLRRILVASKQVHIPPETYVLSQVIEHYRRNAYLEWPTLVKQCMALFELHPEFETFQISLRPLLPKLLALPTSERSLAKVLDMFYCFHAQQMGVDCKRWGDKTPINTFALDDIYAVFPKAKFIHLLRDGVDVVHSYVSSGLIPDIKLAAERWSDSVTLAYDFSIKHAATCIELRYESLSADTHAEMSRVCAFLDMDYDEAMVNKLEHTSAMGDMKKYKHYQHANEAITSQYMGKGRKALAKEELQKIRQIMNGSLKNMGYKPC
ncbi:MAG: sulfotransferase [Mariprofundaceae bacterium]|nr:sulfotransferase [Mariprofundaceae bacterium]